MEGENAAEIFQTSIILDGVLQWRLLLLLLPLQTVVLCFIYLPREEPQRTGLKGDAIVECGGVQAATHALARSPSAKEYARLIDQWQYLSIHLSAARERPQQTKR
jgi:hypothetical protein